jgi:hypothetical protein
MIGGRWYLLDILWLLPVLEILEVVDKAGILHIAPLCQEVEIVRVAQALHKLHFHLPTIIDSFESSSWTRTKLGILNISTALKYLQESPRKNIFYHLKGLSSEI